MILMLIGTGRARALWALRGVSLSPLGSPGVRTRGDPIGGVQML